MTRKEALKKLLEKVQKGDLHYDRELYRTSESARVSEEHVWSSYQRNSLNSVMALHEALLPGWEWGVLGNAKRPAVPAAFVCKQDDFHTDFEAISETPARAWLIAIIKALIAEQAKEPPQ